MMSYRVVFRRSGSDVETLYWNGPLDETQKMARIIALDWRADVFLIVDFDGGGDEVYSEQGPFGRASSHLLDGGVQ